MRIVYIGDDHGTSLHRKRAMDRLGHEVTLINPRKFVHSSMLVSRWLHATGARGISPFIYRPIMDLISQKRPDVVWTDQGLLINSALMLEIKSLGTKIVNYIIDDPFRQGREWMRFRLTRETMRYCDVVVVCRRENIAEAKECGARRVVLVWRSADEVAHRPRELSRQEQTDFASDVVFLGTWFPERGPFTAELIKLGVPLSIWGDRWDRAFEWQYIKPCWRGNGLYNDDQYSAAILSSKICLGLLSKGNRDLHTTRSMEIPALGGLLCAERTSEHLELYREGEEAIFWNDARDCANACKALLANEHVRSKVAKQGHARALQNQHYNERVISSILSEL